MIGLADERSNVTLSAQITEFEATVCISLTFLCSSDVFLLLFSSFSSSSSSSSAECIVDVAVVVVVVIVVSEPHSSHSLGAMVVCVDGLRASIAAIRRL
jgi:hypothetical protein